MAKRMLIDASHLEETRVVVMSGNRVEEFDHESASRQQLKGNIYLAKVTRVEPSLQAAFVDYGGNRHGFLPFNEIHSDYYRIPIADREALLAEEAEMAADRASAVEAEDKETDQDPSAEAPADGSDGEPPESGIEVMGGDDVEDASQRRARHTRRYKIQEVIKRRQIMLIQVTKEERGNKGAALTTYLSLPGRYCVLMPNTPKGGGISRKIVSHKDRRRLKSILEDLKIPQGVSVIVRTAGSERSKAEIRRDYEYLLRLWNQIREETLESNAPSLIYEEANIIKRAIRDLYSREMEEILIEGAEGYKAAKSFMRMLMPSHAKFIQHYKDESVPLFHNHKVESQLDAIHQNTVQLKSGGYIVLSPTEALVSIDVNSGRATRERHIEETALKTNLEAAEEVARQLRLRDLAGLIVIDFIDMEENRHNHQVERRLKDALRHDRARIQVGHISPFGLLEMSRQRLRPSVTEASTEACPRCGGSGVVRSTESAALTVLRAVEEVAIRKRIGSLRVAVPTTVALYLLNEKRLRLNDVEQRLSLRVFVDTDDTLVPPAYRLDRFTDAEDQGAEEPIQVEAPSEQERDDKDRSAAEGRRKRRSRRGRKGRTDDGSVAAEDAAQVDAAAEETSEIRPDAEEEGDDERGKRRRRRGKRGGRRRTRGRERHPGEAAETADEQASPPEPSAEDAPASPEAAPVADSGPDEQPVTDSAATAEDAPAAESRARRRPSRAGRKVNGEDHAAGQTAAVTSEPEAKQCRPERQPDGEASPSDAAHEALAAPRSRPAGRSRRPRRSQPAVTAQTEQPRAAAQPLPVEPVPAPRSDSAHDGPSASTRTPDRSSNGEGHPAATEQTAPEEPAAPTAARATRRRGWWQRLTE